MKIINIVFIALLMAIMIGTASAEMYEAKISVYYPDNINDITNSTWIRYGTRNIGISETEEIMGLKIKLLDIDTETNSALLSIIYNGKLYQNVYMVDTTKIIGENKDVKIELNEIKKQSGTSFDAVTDNDNAVSIWIKPNSGQLLYLSENGNGNTFNPVEFSKESGWSGASNVEEVILKIKRKNEDTKVRIEINGGKWEEVTAGNLNERTFKLQENVKYTITVSYVKIDYWGGESDEVETYLLTINGLEGSSTTIRNTNILIGNYQGKEKESISVQTGVYGTFEESSGTTFVENGVNGEGNYLWSIKFDTPGSKRVNFNGDDGSNGYMTFVISAVATEDLTVTASQKVTNENNNNNLIILLLFAISLIIIAGVLINKKKKRGERHISEQNI